MQYGPVSLLIRGHLHKKSSPLEMWLSFVVQLPCGSTRDGQAKRRQSHTETLSTPYSITPISPCSREWGLCFCGYVA